MKCEGCGAAYDPGDRFCRNCGRRFESEKPAAARADAGAAPPARRKGCSGLLMAAGFGLVLFSILVMVLVQAAPDILKLAGFKPKDLGVQWSEADFESITAKMGIRTDLPPEGSDKSAYHISLSGEQRVDWTLTEAEITAWANTDRPGYWPLSEVQFKLHPDNVMEASCLIDTAKLMTDRDITDYLPQDARGYVSSVGFPVPVYAQARVTFTGPKRAEVELLSFNAAGMSLAGSSQGEYINSILENIVNGALSKAEAVRAESFTTEEGSLRLTGTWFAEMKREPAK